MQSRVSELIKKEQEENLSFSEACENLIYEIQIQNFIHTHLPNIPDWLLQYERFFTDYTDHILHNISGLVLEGKVLTFEIEELKLYIHVLVSYDEIEDIFLHVCHAEYAVKKASDKQAIIDYRKEAYVSFFYSMKNFKDGCFRYTYAHPYVWLPEPKFKDLELNNVTKEWIEKIKALYP